MSIGRPSTVTTPSAAQTQILRNFSISPETRKRCQHRNVIGFLEEIFQLFVYQCSISVWDFLSGISLAWINFPLSWNIFNMCKNQPAFIQNSASSYKIDKCSRFPFSCVIEFLIKLFSSPHLMRCVGSKSTNFAPTDRSFIFALFHNKYTLLLLNWKSLYYPLCFDQGVGQCAVSVSTKIMAASSLTYMRRTSLYNNTQQHSRRSGSELGNLQQQQLCTWVWCSAVQQRHARGAGERERGGEMNLSFDCAAKCWRLLGSRRWRWRSS